MGRGAPAAELMIMVEHHWWWWLLFQVEFARESPKVQQRRLVFTKCCELASFYLGFNGWNLSVVSHTCEALEHQLLSQCKVKLTVKGSPELAFYGEAEETLTLPDDMDPAGRVQAVGVARKLTYQRACENSFSKLVLVTLPTGKISVHHINVL